MILKFKKINLIKTAKQFVSKKIDNFEKNYRKNLLEAKFIQEKVRKIRVQVREIINKAQIVLERFKNRIFLYKNSKLELIALLTFLLVNYLLVWYLIIAHELVELLTTVIEYPQLGLIVAIIVIIFLFILNPIKQVQIQVKRNQPSWVWYSLWTLTILPLLPQWYLNDDQWHMATLWPYNLFFASLLLVFWFLVSERPEQPKRFSFEAVSDDKLGFKDSLDGFIAAFNSINGSVSVMALYGSLGSGKSTFLRMIVEKLEKTTPFLYTYISLTETNEAKDFEKLFAARWQDTLADYYPSIDLSASTNMLKPIFRESDNSFFSSIFDLLIQFNKSFSPTKLSEGDTQSIRTVLNEECAKLFGNIPSFEEKYWIVVIDEIERAKLDEIYRVIEVIERFKSLGLRGLPVKLIFIISTSDVELHKILDGEKEPSKQISHFFFEDPKTFSHSEFVPIPSWKKRIEYVQKRLMDLRKKSNLVNHFDRHEIESKNQLTLEPENSLEQSKNFKMSSKRLLETAILWFAGETPRLVEKVIVDVEFMTNKLLSTSPLTNEERIPFAYTQMLYMSYIKIKYPGIYFFLQRTVDDVSPTTIDKKNSNLSEEVNGKPFQDLSQWFAHLNSGVSTNWNWQQIEILVFGVEPKYQGKFSSNESKRFDQELGYIAPDALKRYIRAGELEPNTEDYQLYLLRKRYQKTNNLRQTINSSEELYLFARRARELVSTSFDYHFVISKYILEWIINGKSLPDAMSYGKSTFFALSLEIILNLVSAFNQLNETSPSFNEGLKKIGQVITKYLCSKEIAVGSRMYLLEVLFKEEESSNLFQLSRMSRALIENKFLDPVHLSKRVFEDFDKDYAAGKKSIYEEEHPGFALTQYWSGDVNDKASIQKIRSIAKRDLHKFPKAIKRYWSFIPFKKDANHPEDVFSDFDDLGKENSRLLVELKDLMAATNQSKIQDKEVQIKLKQWTKFGNAGIEKYNRRRELKEEITLQRHLKKIGYL